ncbi:hypothetical protein PBY51_022098 [Eleginops maclovinus]|uniref:Uncharacterized protein n=1 Tax=Eleginops maclovinus TaxID=56733 RepID=A0AAN8AFB6_ELEMC|nr:hypothetical protein PBY51_022098 [Eleginops maclovinus]
MITFTPTTIQKLLREVCRRCHGAANRGPNFPNGVGTGQRLNEWGVGGINLTILPRGPHSHHHHVSAE